MKRIYFLISIFLPLLGGAQTALTLDECISLAKENNNRIAAAKFGVGAARFDKRSARANFLPTFSATGMGLYSDADGTLAIEGGMLPVLGADGVPTGASAYFPGVNLDYKVGCIYNVGLKVEQPLFMGGRVYGYKMARIGESVAVQNSRLTQSEVVVATSRAYANVVRAVQMQKVAASYNALLKELMRSVEKAYGHGAKSRNDVLKVKVKLSESELNMRRAENAVRLATMNLCHYIGRPLNDVIEVDGELPEESCSVENTTDVSQRPEALMLSQKSELMRLKTKMARAEMLPTLGLVGQYGYLHGLEVNGKNLFDNWNMAVGVQLSVPLFSFGGNSGKYRSAKMQYKQVLADEKEKLSLMTLEVVQAANNLDEAACELSLAEATVASATENLRVSSSQYKAGVETLSDHLEAQAIWQQAGQTLVDARVNRYLRLVEYRKAAGAIE